MTRTWKTEFSEFGELPMKVPEGFVDVSWRAEPCPCWADARMGVTLCVDFEDPRDRARPTSPRYVLSGTEEGTTVTAGEDHVILASDDWTTVEDWIDARRAELASTRERFGYEGILQVETFLDSSGTRVEVALVRPGPMVDRWAVIVHVDCDPDEPTRGTSGRTDHVNYHEACRAYRAEIEGRAPPRPRPAGWADAHVPGM